MSEFQVARLIDQKQTRAYDEAVAHLVDLCELADDRGSRAQFDQRLATLLEQTSRRPALLNRLRAMHLL